MADDRSGGYRCVICRAEVTYRGELPIRYPFCSERCQLVDLGLWFREAYAIDRDITPEELGGRKPANGPPVEAE